MPSAADKRRKQARAAAQASSSGQEQLPLRPAGQATNASSASGPAGNAAAMGSAGSAQGVARTIDEQTKRENELLAKSNESTSVSMPHRPAFGTAGRPSVVLANYFPLRIKPDLAFIRYSVEVKRGESLAGKAIAKRIIQLLILDHINVKQVDAVSDLASMVITSAHLSQLEYEVIYRAEGQTQPEDDALHYNVTLTLTGPINLLELVSYAAAAPRGPDYTETQAAITALNIAVGYNSRIHPNTETLRKNVRVSIIPNQERWDLNDGVEGLRAFAFSVRPSTERLLINVQIKNLAFLKAESLGRLRTSSVGGPNAAEGPLVELVRQCGMTGLQLESFLKMVKIRVTHIQRRGKNGNVIERYKTIVGLARKNDGKRSDGKGMAHPPKVDQDAANAKQVSFWLDESTDTSGSQSSKPSQDKARASSSMSRGRYITVFDFFRERYPAHNIDTQWPVVNVGSKESPSYLPMEVCRIRPGQLTKRPITPQQTDAMIKSAVRSPVDNQVSITGTGLSLLALDPGNGCTMGISVTKDLLKVPARFLQAPAINYSSKVDVQAASWNLKGHRLARAIQLHSWTWVNIRHENQPSLTSQEIRFFAAELCKYAGLDCPRGMPSVVDHTFDTPSGISNMVQKIANSPGKSRLIMVILPPVNNTAIYNAVKYACDVEYGLLCQCMLSSKMTKRATKNSRGELVWDLNYFANVGLKLNLKLGGMNQISNPNSTLIDPKQTMFVGLDVTHPSPGSKATAPSVAAIVASVDGHLAQWPAAIKIQRGRQEMVDDLTELFEGRLKLWSKKNQGKYPVNIILYRDGVSEGQYDQVLKLELPSIQKAVTQLYPPKHTPKISIIIVGKRHHTRFYPIDDKDKDRKQNTKSGLVVDRGVTQHSHWDFFLQAHTALQGTVKPAHYYVIYDEIFKTLKPGFGNAADALEQVTHSLCYLFGRSTTAVSVCPPAKYADIVCERARCYLPDQFAPDSGSVASDNDPNAPVPQISLHPAIKDSMFYI